ncbi:MAG: DNA polymerase III subunit beta [Coriobacteriia bacterium]|nr:DNA polymerase III subunit beta [Coriobacteriia bacterium]
MKFVIEKNQLLSSLSAVSKGMSARSTMPILSGVLMIVEEGLLTLRTTDLEISIQNQTPAMVETPGETVVPGRLFTDIVKTLPEASVTIEDSGSGLDITSGDSFFSLNTLNPLDYPNFPKVDKERQITIEAKDLQRMIKRASKAVSRDESRPVLKGVLLKIQEGSMSLVATDSYRLAVVDKTIENESDFELIVPGEVLEEIAKISSPDDVVTITEAENQIMFEVGQTVFVSRKIEGNYPNYEALIPSDSILCSTINTSTFYQAVKRVSLASHPNGPMKLVFDPIKQKLTISSKTVDRASGSETIEAHIEGEYLEIGFNHQYIADGLSVIEEDEILFETQGPMKAGVIKTNGEDSFLYLTMPLRVDI